MIYTRNVASAGISGLIATTPSVTSVHVFCPGTTVYLRLSWFALLPLGVRGRSALLDGQQHEPRRGARSAPGRSAQMLAGGGWGHLLACDERQNLGQEPREWAAVGRPEPRPGVLRRHRRSECGGDRDRKVVPARDVRHLQPIVRIQLCLHRGGEGGELPEQFRFRGDGGGRCPRSLPSEAPDIKEPL